MLATGNSQLVFLAELVTHADIDWSRVTRVPHGRVRRPAADPLGELPALHARAGRRATCRSWSSTTCSGDTGDAEAEARRYADAAARAPARPLLLRHRGERPPRVQRPAGRRLRRPARREGRRARARVAPPAGRRGALRDDRRRADARDHRHDPRVAARTASARDRARGAQGESGARRRWRDRSPPRARRRTSARSRTRRCTSTPSRRHSSPGDRFRATSADAQVLLVPEPCEARRRSRRSWSRCSGSGSAVGARPARCSGRGTCPPGLATACTRSASSCSSGSSCCSRGSAAPASGSARVNTLSSADREPRLALIPEQHRSCPHRVPRRPVCSASAAASTSAPGSARSARRPDDRDQCTGTALDRAHDRVQRARSGLPRRQVGGRDRLVDVAIGP